MKQMTETYSYLNDECKYYLYIYVCIYTVYYYRNVLY